MKTMILRPLLFGLLLALSACGSTKEKNDPMAADAGAVMCICGTPDAAFDGCPYALCVSGEGNPDNPDCVCGTLTYDDGM